MRQSILHAHHQVIVWNHDTVAQPVIPALENYGLKQEDDEWTQSWLLSFQPQNLSPTWWSVAAKNSADVEDAPVGRQALTALTFVVAQRDGEKNLWELRTTSSRVWWN